MQQDLAVARRGVGAVGHGWCATLLESVAQTCRCREVVLARLEVKKQAGLQDTCRALQCPRRVVRDVSKCEGPSNWVGHPRRAATLGSGDCFVRHSFIEPCTGVCRSRPAPGGDARLRGVSFAVGVVVVLRAAARWTTSLPRRMSWRPTCARTRRTQLCWRILRPGLSVQGGGVVASPWFACTLIEASRSALGVPWCLATFSPGLDAMPICVCGQGVRRTALRWERGTIPLFKQLTHLYA